MASWNGNIFRVTGHLCGNSPVPGEFLAQRPVRRSFDVFFDLHMNKRLSKQSWGWWFETPSCPLWRHCNVYLAWVTWKKISQYLASDEKLHQCISNNYLWVNQLISPWEIQFTSVYFKLILQIEILIICIKWEPQNPPIDDKSTLVQVMAWCHQASSHYLSQCWPRSMSPYGVTKPQWIHDITPWHVDINTSWLVYSIKLHGSQPYWMDYQDTIYPASRICRD